MRVLIIGGTIFFGRHLCDSLLSSGHTVTMFNRGRQPYKPPEAVEIILGDRNADLSLLGCRSWDVVIDTCGYYPAQVSESARALSGKAGTYVFISSINQYLYFTIPDVDENCSPRKVGWIRTSVVNERNYGFLKRLCEAEVRRRFEGKTLILRPGCMVGPFDQAARFSYWVKRCSLGGEMLAPGEHGQHYQVIDVRDVTDWLVNYTEAGGAGIFNLVGPERPYCIGDMLDEVGSICGAKSSPVWIKAKFLRKRGGGKRFLTLGEWAGLPSKRRYLYDVSNSKVVCAGLVFRSLKQTVTDINNWLNSLESGGKELLIPAEEERLISSWHRRISF